MDHVQGAAGLSRQVERAADRFDFGGPGARIEVIAGAGPALGHELLRKRAGYGLAFGVEGHDGFELGRAFHSFAQRTVIDRGGSPPYHWHT